MNKGHFFIIARRAQWMYEAMKQSFAGHADIGVILDRRRRERRWQTIPIEVDRRARERRAVDTAWTSELIGQLIRLRLQNGLDDVLVRRPAGALPGVRLDSAQPSSYRGTRRDPRGGVLRA